MSLEDNNVTMLKDQIAEKQKEIQAIFTELGEAFYKQHKDDEISEFHTLCQEISSRYKMIDQMNGEILELTMKDAKICPNCGTKNEKDSLFCGECGCKLPDENSCPSCGAPIMEGDRFCRNCGSKIEHRNEQTEEVLAQRVCKNCGEPLEEGAAFCIYCGTRN